MAKSDPLINQTLGEFRILRLLGSGGMGRVYLAEQAALQREVAVKVLSQHIVEDQSAIERFKREAILAAKLTHTNIAHVYTIGELEDVHFVAMELISGGDVSDIMKGKGRLPVDEAVQIIRQALLGIGSAHAEGIIHRDIKPQNLMLTADGTVKVTDFGLARALAADSSLTASGAILGTPLYMSPEQAESKPTDHRTDIYSLGATLFHMLCDEPPFTGNTPVSVLLKHVSHPLTFPEDIGSAIPAKVATFIRKMMAKEPDKRFQSCEEALASLDAALQGMETKTGTGITPVPQKPKKKTGRRKKKKKEPEQKVDQNADTVPADTIVREEMEVRLAQTRPDPRVNAGASASRGRGRALVFSGIAAAAVLTISVYFLFPRGNRGPTTPSTTTTVKPDAIQNTTTVPATPSSSLSWAKGAVMAFSFDKDTLSNGMVRPI